MKKIIILIVLAFNFLQAQTDNILPTGVQVTPEGIEMPVIVTNKFNIDHPNNEVSWEKDDDNYAAAYTNQSTNTKHIIVYGEDGNLIHSDKEITTGLYPKKIDDYFTKNFSKEKYTIWLSEDNNGNKSYYAIRESNTFWFDKNGNYLSAKNKEVTKN